MFGTVANPPDPAKDTPDREITTDELARHNGSDPTGPIYLAIRGVVFDVSSARDMYAEGSGYSLFAGKDASYGLATSSLDPKDAHGDISTLTDAQRKVLGDWEAFYRKKYNVVGKVVP